MYLGRHSKIDVSGELSIVWEDLVVSLQVNELDKYIWSSREGQIYEEKIGKWIGQPEMHVYIQKGK